MRAVTLLLSLLLATTLAANDLDGLWKAKKRFGPDARGTLVLERRGTNWTADFLGQLLPVEETNGALRFALPEGRFEGRLENGSVVRGLWRRFGTAVSGAGRPAPISASPVTLTAGGPNRFRGLVDPVEDVFTFYLLLKTEADGSIRALLRNPEFDLGTQQAVERLVRDGNRLRLIGKRGGTEREVATGTFDPERGVVTLVFPTRGGSYDFERDAPESSAFYPRGMRPGRYKYTPPLPRDDGWPVSTLEEQAIDQPTIEMFVQRILDRSMDSPEAPQHHGLLIARNGKLVVEEYFHGEHRDKLHTTRSASKSLTSLVVGAAMHAGAPLELSSPVYQVMNGGTFPAGLDAQKKAMSLEDLLTMSAGFLCDDTSDDAPGREDTMWDQTEEPDFYRYLLRVPLSTPPGKNSVYCSGISNLALGMAGRAARENPISIFRRLIGDPLKIRRFEWGLDPAGNPYGGGGVNLLLRDFAKLGQLMLNGGTWEGRRILGEDFAERTASPLYNLRRIHYGYQWWVEDYPYKMRTVRSYSARGAGGQTVTVVPDLQLVVATFAGNFSSGKGMRAASTDPIPNTILPAVRERGDDPSAPVVERQYVSPYGASKDGSRNSALPPRRD